MADNKQEVNVNEAREIKVNPKGQHIRKVVFDREDMIEKVDKDRQVNVKVDVGVEDIEKEVSSVVLKIAAESEGDKVFKIEVEYIGKYEISAEEKEIKEEILRVSCAHMLYPYVVRLMSAMIDEAELPKFRMMPIDFRGMFVAQKEREKRVDMEEVKILN